MRALLPAAHGDEQLRSGRQLGGEPLRPGARQVDARFAHHRGHLGVDAIARRRSRRDGLRPGRVGQRPKKAAAIWDRPAL